MQIVSFREHGWADKSTTHLSYNYVMIELALPILLRFVVPYLYSHGEITSYLPQILFSPVSSLERCTTFPRLTMLIPSKWRKVSVWKGIWCISWTICMAGTPHFFFWRDESISPPWCCISHPSLGSGHWWIYYARFVVLGSRGIGLTRLRWWISCSPMK